MRVSRRAVRRTVQAAGLALAASVFALLGVALFVPSAPGWLLGDPVQMGGALVLVGLALSLELPLGAARKPGGRPAP